jgi:methyltransferase-like protein
MIRDMMLYHVRNTPAASDRISAARWLLNFLVEKVGTAEVANLSATDTAAYSAALRYEQALLAQYQDSYVYHEHLEDINEPVYFSEFIRRAGQHGLQYVSEADFVSAQIANFSPAVAETIRSLSGDVTEAQQYMDFVSNRTFRQTVLCRDTLTLHRTATPDRLADLFVASPIQPASSSIDITSANEESFNSHTGRTLTASTPVIKAAFLHLGQSWPNFFSLEALLAAAYERLQPGAPQVFSAKQVVEDKLLLGQTLLQCFAQGLVELHSHPALYRTQIDTHPVASLVARLQARSGSMVANLRHEMVQLDEISRQLIVYLDGAHDRAELFNIMADLVRAGSIVVQGTDGKPVVSEESRNSLLAEKLNQTLQSLAGSGLLVG